MKDQQQAAELGQVTPEQIAAASATANARLQNAQAEWNHLDASCAALEQEARDGRIRQHHLKREIETLLKVVEDNRSAATILDARQRTQALLDAAEAEHEAAKSKRMELDNQLAQAKAATEKALAAAAAAEEAAKPKE
jgi:hypothetical protein